MQLVVHIKLEEPLSLPINYNHILQAVIYRALSIMPDYSQFLHAGGFTRGQRKYKIFQFSQLDGEYRIREKNNHVSFLNLEYILLHNLRSSFPLNDYLQ